MPVVDAVPATPAAILQQLRSFHEMGSVLYVAAHPDDENTQLIAYLARGRNYRTAYLSLTRGDGGQNVLGPELGEELGVIRTYELLAARQTDGGRQFFSRAVDFGFSKDYRETLRIWDRDQVLSDVVRVIRKFRPDVVITRFPTEPGGTHGHHTASAVLALEAFKIAGSSNAFPDQLQELTPWQPRRILLNSWRGGRGGEASTNTGLLQMDIGGTDPVSGDTFSTVAARSRSMHKTQGFGNFTGFGGGTRPEMFQLLDGEPATNDILDGVDTTWARIPGAAEIGRMSGEIISSFNPKDPAASVPALLSMRRRLAGIAPDPIVKEKSAQLDAILQACLGLSVETVVSRAEVVPGEEMKLRHVARVRSAIPVKWLAVRYPAGGHDLTGVVELHANQEATRDTTQQLPGKIPLTQPYWLRAEDTVGMFRVDDPSLIGCPENPPAFPVQQVFEVDGQKLVIPDQPVQIARDTNQVEVRRRLEVIPPVSLDVLSEVELFRPGASHEVAVEITASRPKTIGTASLEAPSGWKISPATRPFQLADEGQKIRVKFVVTAPAAPGTGRITAAAVVNGVRFDNKRVELHYSHVPAQLLQPAARFRAVAVDAAVLSREIGYIPGAGDRIPEALEQLGCHVTILSAPEVTRERLQKLDAVVVGIRAFNTRTDMAAMMPALFQYAEDGGTVVEQYNTANGLKTDKIAPFDLHISNDRVTDEEAPMTFLAPDHPVLNVPNRITSADFDGWVQERGLYFPNQWDERFTPILACNDPGEPAKKGGLLVGRVGRGYWVYTGLAWFRQLPAGVPGAYRLFANIISLGHSAEPALTGGSK